jgi:hypothetical protein
LCVGVVDFGFSLRELSFCEVDKSAQAHLDAKIKDYSWHCNRHTFASRLVMAGVDLRTVAELITEVVTKSVTSKNRHSGSLQTNRKKLLNNSDLQQVAP